MWDQGLLIGTEYRLAQPLLVGRGVAKADVTHAQDSPTVPPPGGGLPRGPQVLTVK